MAERIESYADALRYIYGFADYERTAPRQREFQRLDDVLALLDAVGDPHQRLRAIHVAGTKGKGSTAAMLTAVLLRAGNAVGTYTSPHLNTHRERYRLDGSPVSEEAFAETLRDLQPAVERVRAERRITTFEVAFALACTLFARAGVDWAVVEVGLGGRLDTTNVLTPALSAITSISLDHTEILGDTIEQIAADKAGIVKPGVPVVIAPQRQEARGVIEDRARELGTPALAVSDLASAAGYRIVSPERQEFTLRTRRTLHGESLDGCVVGMNLIGAHQVENALTTIVAATALDPAGARITRDHLLGALERVHWPGRFEVVPGEPSVVLDGAHNPYSVRKLRETVDQVFPGRRICWVFGALRGHDEGAMLGELHGQNAVLCRSIHPKALPVAVLEHVAHEHGIVYRTAETVAGALALAREGMDLVVVTGSLSVVGDAREALGRAEGLDPVRS